MKIRSHMKKMIFILTILLLITSCKKNTDYQLRILIKNKTDSLMTVHLYPKDKYIQYGQYIFSSIRPRLKDTTFIPDSKLGSELFITDELNIEPQQLATNVFDSINLSYPSGRLIRFSPQRAVNYSVNLFTDKSAWLYEKNKFEYIRTWRENYIESDDYTFLIAVKN